MKLIIAEKPSVAQSLAAVIGAKTRRDGYLEGGGYIVSWCFGHLAGLADAEIYNSDYAKWTLKDLPIVPEQFRFSVRSDKQKQFMEDDYGMIDGIINNGEKQPTVAELEQQARSGQPISLMDLAAAPHRERQQKRKSVLEQLRQQPEQSQKKSAPKKSAEREI